MATLIKTDGNRSEITPAEGHAFSLKEMQGFVGGYIEILPLADGRVLVINEEGKLNDLPYNDGATALYLVNRAWYDAIVGDALLCSREEGGG